MNTAEQDRFFMQAALEEAAVAESLQEVPIGAVVVLDGQIALGFTGIKHLKKIFLD